MKRSAIPGPKVRINPLARKIIPRSGIKLTAGIGERAGTGSGVKTGQGHTGIESEDI
jgi:hypothetical protein